MKNRYYLFVLALASGLVQANMLDEELDLRISDSTMGDLEQRAGDVEVAAIGEELALAAQEAEAAAIRKRLEEEPTEILVAEEQAKPEEIVVVEEQPAVTSEEEPQNLQDIAAQEEELRKLLAELELEEQANNE